MKQKMMNQKFMNSAWTSQALRDVWEWKDSIYREVQHLPLPDALSAILDRASQAAEEMGFRPGVASNLAEKKVKRVATIKGAHGSRKTSKALLHLTQ